MASSAPALVALLFIFGTGWPGVSGAQTASAPAETLLTAAADGPRDDVAANDRDRRAQSRRQARSEPATDRPQGSGRSPPVRPAGAPPNKRGEPGGRFKRGQVLDPSQRGSAMADYGRYHLRQPPPGYSYHRVGNQAYLVSDETGLIFEVAPLDH